MCQRVKKLIAIKKINSVKSFKAGKNYGANSEHKHSEIERFLMLNKRIIN